MTLFDLFTLLGGLAFFLYGMNVMSSGLEQLAGGKLEQVLRKMTSNKVKAMGLGVVITAIIQSSSAVTVMLVGLVNSGIMQLGQSIGVIMGSNIGTTVTAWLLSMTAIDGSSTINPVLNFILTLLKPSSFTPILALIGILLMMMGKSKKKKSVGSILLGFAILMEGMELMSGSVEGLSGSAQFQSILTVFSNPVIGILIGTAFTAIIQSSSASVGILQALSTTGAISYATAIPIIIGQNIGTCITGLISSLGTTKKDAKRVAIVHVIIKVIGAVVWGIVFYGINAIVNFAFMDDKINPVGIAVVHTLFNVVNTILLLPFTKQLEKLSRLVLRDSAAEQESQEKIFLDERLLNTPSVAIAECNRMTVKMSKCAHETLKRAFELLNNYNDECSTLIQNGEDELDKYEDKLGTLLVKISSKEISEADSHQVSRMLHSIGDFERLGDHAVNLMKVAAEMNEKKIAFSEDACAEIAVLQRATDEILDRTMEAYRSNSSEKAAFVEPLEQVIDLLIADIKRRHIERLKNGNCTIELGFVLSDLLNNYERISDHCSNIAVAIIEVNMDSFETHGYLSDIKQGLDSVYASEYARCREEYKLD